MWTIPENLSPALAKKAEQIAKALAELGPAQYVPGDDGLSVQVEWHRDGFDIEIDIYEVKKNDN